MRKWIVGFLILGTILWLYSYHERHLPCAVVRNTRTGGLWNCPAGTIAFSVRSSRAKVAEISVTAPILAYFNGNDYVLGVGRAFFVGHARNETVRLESKVPFSIRLMWF